MYFLFNQLYLEIEIGALNFLYQQLKETRHTPTCIVFSQEWPLFSKDCGRWKYCKLFPKNICTGPLFSLCRKCLLNRGQISVIDHLNPSPLTAVSSIYQFPPDYCPDQTSNNWTIVITELDVLNLLCKSRYLDLQSPHSKNGRRVRFSQFQQWIFFTSSLVLN